MKKQFACFVLLMCIINLKTAQAKLTAEVSASQDVFYEEKTRPAVFTFFVRNHGKQAEAVDWRASQLYLNNKEIKNWAESIDDWHYLVRSDTTHRFNSLPLFAQSLPVGFGSGKVLLTEKRVQMLPAGREMRFVGDLGGFIERPGTYVLQWKSKNYSSPPLTFQVLPLKNLAKGIIPDEIKLVQLIRTKLPAGWRVFYEERELWRDNRLITLEHEPVRNPDAYELIRKQPNRGFGNNSPIGNSKSQARFFQARPQTVPSFGGGSAESAEEEKKQHSPANFRLKSGYDLATYRPRYSFAVKPFLTPDGWQEKREINNRLLKIMREISSKWPDSKRLKGQFYPTTPEEKQEFAVYQKIEGTLVSLPRFYFGNIAVDYEWRPSIGGLNGFHEISPAFPETEKAEAEKAALIEMVESLLTPCEPKDKPEREKE